MATNQTHSSSDRHPLLEKFNQMPAAAAGGLFLYSVKSCAVSRRRQTVVVVLQAPGRACTPLRSTFKISIQSPRGL
jgi:hypothetical protein